MRAIAKGEVQRAARILSAAFDSAQKRYMIRQLRTRVCTNDRHARKSTLIEDVAMHRRGAQRCTPSPLELDDILRTYKVEAGAVRGPENLHTPDDFFGKTLGRDLPRIRSGRSGTMIPSAARLIKDQ